MYNFYERYKVTKLNKEERDNPLFIKGIDFTVKIFSTKKITGPDTSLVSSSKHLRKR